MAPVNIVTDMCGGHDDSMFTEKNSCVNMF
jgi:hypothetical protein